MQNIHWEQKVAVISQQLSYWYKVVMEAEYITKLMLLLWLMDTCVTRELPRTPFLQFPQPQSLNVFIVIDIINFCIQEIYLCLASLVDFALYFVPSTDTSRAVLLQNQVSIAEDLVLSSQVKNTIIFPNVCFQFSA